METLGQVLAVGFVLLLLFAAVWVLRRSGRASSGRASSGFARLGLGIRSRGGSKRALESFDRLPLAPNHALHLVRVAGRGLAIVTHPAGCTLLKDLPWNEIEEAAPAKAAGSARAAGRS